MKLSLSQLRKSPAVYALNAKKLNAKAGRSTKGVSSRSASGLEELALLQIHLAGLPSPQREYRFCDRRYRLDLCWPERRCALEIHGGTWNGGRHVRGKGFENDRAKMNEARLLGWTVIEATADQVKSGEAIGWVERALNGCG